MTDEDGGSVMDRLRAQGVAPDATDADLLRLTGHEGAHEARDFLTRNRIPFDYSPAPGRLRVDLPSGQVLLGPSLPELAEAAGCAVRPEHDDYDLVVVGAGPAGLAASVYGAAEGLRTLTVEQLAPGGQAGTSSLIENYPGFPDGISGNALAERTRAQAVRLGAEIVLVRSVVDGGTTDEGRHTVVLDDGTVVSCGAVVCSTGVDWRRLDAPGVDDFYGSGVYYGAATSEAPGVQDRDVLVVGGGNSAGQAALFLSRWARSVTVAVRGVALADTLSHYLHRRIEQTDNVHVETGTELTAADGDDWLRTVTLHSRSSGTSEERDMHAVFVCIGGTPRTEWAEHAGIVRDAGGYLVTGRDLLTEEYGGRWRLERPPDVLETSQPLLFATGDVRHGSTKRIATAMGEGALVVQMVQDRLAAG